jgi:hypothetical protein
VVGAIGAHLVRLLAILAILVATNAWAEDRNVIAAFRFDMPVKDLTPVERQRALAYRGELQSQLRVLDHDALRGRLDPLGRRLLLDTRGELGRMDDILLPQPSIRAGASGSRMLPSLSGRSPLLAP